MTCKLNDIISSNKIEPYLTSVLYGTTGFRMNYKYLDGFIVRMSFIAAMRSIFKNASVGLMITASHNLECDNGIKLIDPNGDMLEHEWELIAEDFIKWNANEFLLKFQEKCHILNINFSNKYKGHVLIGFDTRSSSPYLADKVSNTLKELGTEFLVLEYVTTPQLHFFVKQLNCNSKYTSTQLIELYFERLAGGFCRYKDSSKSRPILNVDCANGVGARHLLHLSKLVGDYLELKLHNTTNENLNLKCGADYVKIEQSVPVLYTGDQSLACIDRWCAIDGDSDRLIYFFTSAAGQFHLLDGDKMAVLISNYLCEILKPEIDSKRFSIAIIQTAYANSASTKYIESQLKIEPICVPTGVKHLHKAAKEYDIGIYFEANGHGTVLFSENLRQYSEGLNDMHELKRFISIVNDADGDAISDILIIEHILSVRNWSLEDWSNLYTDYPNRQLKVPVPDRNVIKTTDAERRIESPAHLQNAIDDAIKDHLGCGANHARAFVRPSGTENIVRVYAESSNQLAADHLANSIAILVTSVLA